MVARVRGPQQAQQAWDLLCLLASRPLPQLAAQMVANMAVQLVNVSVLPCHWTLGFHVNVRVSYGS